MRISSRFSPDSLRILLSDLDAFKDAQLELWPIIRSILPEHSTLMLLTNRPDLFASATPSTSHCLHLSMYRDSFLEWSRSAVALSVMAPSCCLPTRLPRCRS